VQVLLYLTPLHCQDMLDSVVVSLNATVHKFLARNPGFKVLLHIVVLLSINTLDRLALAAWCLMSRFYPAFCG